jgi:hypothetical protein
MMYFSRNSHGEFDLHGTAKAAKDACEKHLAEMRSVAAHEGWIDDEMDMVCWGEMTIKQHAVKCDVRQRPDGCGTEQCELECDTEYGECEWPDSEWPEVYNYKLEDWAK